MGTVWNVNVGNAPVLDSCAVVVRNPLAAVHVFVLTLIAFRPPRVIVSSPVNVKVKPTSEASGIEKLAPSVPLPRSKVIAPLPPGPAPCTQSYVTNDASAPVAAQSPSMVASTDPGKAVELQIPVGCHVAHLFRTATILRGCEQLRCCRVAALAPSD